MSQGGARPVLCMALVLLLTGTVGSALYWSAPGNGAYLVTQEAYGEALEAAGQSLPGALEAADRQWSRVNRAARLVEAHGHLLFLCVLLVLLALLLDSVPGGRQAALLAMAGVLVYPIGLVVQAAHVRAGQALAAAGAIMVLLALGRVAHGLFRSGRRGPA